MQPTNKRNDAAVDEILKELKSTKAPAGKVDSQKVDDILAEMGFASASKQSPRFVLGSTEPGKTAPEKPAEKKPARQQTKAPAEKKPEEKRTAPAARPAEPAPQAKKGRKVDQEAQFEEMMETAIEETGRTRPETTAPRLGKAAAFDRVDRDKYRGNTELLEFFAGEEQPELSKKEQRRLEKERRQQRAAERRAQKPEKQRGEEYPEGEEAGAYAEAIVSQEHPGADEMLAEEIAAKPLFDGARDIDEFFAMEAEDSADGASADAMAAPGREVTGPRGIDSAAIFEAADSKEHAETRPDATRAFAVPRPEAPPEGKAVATSATRPFAVPQQKDEGGEQGEKRFDTQQYELEGTEPDEERVPTAAFTQEFETEGQPGGREAEKSLFIDEMVDERFRDFFSETVIVDREEIDEEQAKRKTRTRKTRTRSSLLTGEFAQLAEQAEQAETEREEDFDDYSRPQDAEAVEKDIEALRSTLTLRTIGTGAVALLLLWLGLGHSALLPLPAFMAPVAHPLFFGVVYLLLVGAAIGINFTTVATGLVGLVSEPTVDTPPALAAVGALLQSVVVLVQAIGAGSTLPAEPAAVVTLFGGVAALLLVFNNFGKRMRAVSILGNFRLASGGFDHSAAYLLDNSQELAYSITKGLAEEEPVLLVSRPTALVKGFLRQSFSRRGSDQAAKILGWVLLGCALVAGALAFVQASGILIVISSLAAVLCVGAPLSSTLLSAIPSLLLQRSTAKVGAVVPGWSAIEELGEVNVIMAGARDLVPPSSVVLKGIKTFEKERIDLAILYAASVLAECDTLRDLFLGVVQGKSDMLYKVDSLTVEPGRGFTAWVQNSRIVIGNREMLQKHAVTPPSMEAELKYTKDGNLPIYLAVSGKLFAMFVVAYRPDPEVQDMLDSLVNSGVSLLVESNDMNITGELLERLYALPPGVAKVLGSRELELLEPLTNYLPESDGVMTHIGTFTSFIGGMRAAAACAASERMSGIVQAASVVVACLLCLVLAFAGSLPGLSLLIVLLYQLGWTVLVGALPFSRRF